MGTQTIEGKAFEYACLKAFADCICYEKGRNVFVDGSEPCTTAKEAFRYLSPERRDVYMLAAKTAVKLLLPLEPQLEFGSGDLLLALNSDSAGQAGDVRDLLFIRNTEGWEIGISCKHNHEALKHPRITRSCNFARDWTGHDCSWEFINNLNQILEPLDGTRLWIDFPNKHRDFYVPILENFIREIDHLCYTYSDFPEAMLRYFFGREDFYKIISQESSGQTKVMGFNMTGTMNRPAAGIRPIYRVPVLKMPTRLYDINFDNGSTTTIILVFDGGWTVKMRLHNKDKYAKPTSLAWDINLVGMPHELYQQQRSWYE